MTKPTIKVKLLQQRDPKIQRIIGDITLLIAHIARRAFQACKAVMFLAEIQGPRFLLPCFSTFLTWQSPPTCKARSWALLCPSLRGGSLGLNPEKVPIPATHCPLRRTMSLGCIWRLGSMISSLMAMYPVTVHSLWKNGLP